LDPEVFQATGILIATLGGAAVGVERERSGRAHGPAARFAGVRTFTLLGGLAGIAGWLWQAGFAFLGGAMLAGAVGLVVVAYAVAGRKDVDATTEVAALVVLAAGVMSGVGHASLASGIFALTVLLLVEKSRLHSMVQRLDDASFRAGIRFAVMAVVILPLLPPGPYGPLGGFRPRELWLLTLFFSALSFAGYLARRLVGAQKGYAIAGLLGGIVSSTNVTFTFARLSRNQERIGEPLAHGVVAACNVLLIRVLVATAVLNPSLALALVPYLVLPFLVGVLALLPLLRRAPADADSLEPVKNPLQLGSALQMAVLFQVVLFGVHAAQTYFGEAGVLASGAVLGLTDMDALTISMARTRADVIPVAIAAQGIAIGILSNSVMKMALAVVLGRGAFRWRAGGVLFMIAGATAASLAWLR